MPEINEQVDERKAYLLDISLFLFEILSPEKIINKSLKDNVVFEVPGAFVTMILSSTSGSTILWDFIYAHFIGLRNNGMFAQNPHEDIRMLAHATDQSLKKHTEIAYKNILTYYSQLIEGIKSQGRESTFSPIRRYEPILPDQTEHDLQKMRNAYITQFGISSHPLYDLYFLQVYHAQSIGIAASPLLKRIFAFFGKQVSGAITRWVGETNPEALNLETQERYKKSLKWFLEECIADQLLDTAIDGILGVGISFVVAGVPAVSILSGISVAGVVTNVAKKAVVEPIVKSPYLTKEDKITLLKILVVVPSKGYIVK